MILFNLKNKCNINDAAVTTILIITCPEHYFAVQLLSHVQPFVTL